MVNFNVTKRDGEIADFDLSKISNAIKKAFNATEQLYNDDIINLLSLRVTSAFQSKIKEGCVSVEDIQDCVEEVLNQTGYNEVAKAYILYRKNREKIRNMKSSSLFSNTTEYFLLRNQHHKPYVLPLRRKV